MIRFSRGRQKRIFPRISALVEMVIEPIRALPPKPQDEHARLLLDMAEGGDVYARTPEEASLAESTAQPERGEFAPRDAVEAM